MRSDEDETLPPEATLLRAISRAGRARREAAELTTAMLGEGVFADEVDDHALVAPTRLAAASHAAPLHGLFVGGGWRLRFARALDGAPLVELEAGPSAAWLIVGALRLRLRVGEAILAPSLPTVGSPLIEDERGQAHPLSPSS